MTSIMIGTCRERVGYYEHTDSILAAMRYLAEKDVRVGQIVESPTYIHIGRQNIVDAFLGTDCEYLCFVDSDNVIHPETIWRLIQRDLPIVGATYFKRKGAPEVVACQWADGERNAVYTASIELKAFVDQHEIQPLFIPTCLDIEDSLLNVDVLGFGCTLIHRQVLESLKAKYNNIFGEHGETLGEDIVFCKRAQDAGFSIYLDMSLFVGHITTFQISLAHFVQVQGWQRT